MNMFGYETKTTFWQDFSIADMFGVASVIDTFDRAFKHWKHDHIYLTELVMVLNWKMWQHDEMGNKDFVSAYEELWSIADEYACENLKGEELAYFFKTTD